VVEIRSTQVSAEQPFPLGQAVPGQPPQWALLVLGLMQLPWQAMVPPTHALGGLQAPRVHTSELAQVIPQPPQFFGSLTVTTHWPAQRVALGPQPDAGSGWHVAFGAQTRPPQHSLEVAQTTP
jgi:hypothetical protein